MDTLLLVLSSFADLFTVIASGIAIYLYIFKRDTISSAFKVLVNYSYQITLSELRAKLERLNDLNENEPTHVEQIINILNEIVGQIRGNKNLRHEFEDVLEKISELAENPKGLTEPKKRSLVSELREGLRHYDVNSYKDMMEDKK